MIEYIIPTNIDDRILKRAAEALRNGGLIAHPTDTSWHISCAMSSNLGLSKLIALKDTNNFPIMVRSLRASRELVV